MLALSKKDQSYLDKLLKNLAGKKKLSNIQQQIVLTSQIDPKSEEDVKKLRLLINADRSKTVARESSKQALQIDKDRLIKAQALLEQKQKRVGEVFLSAIMQDAKFSDKFSYAKFLTKMFEQGHFTAHDRVLLSEYLAKDVDQISSVNSSMVLPAEDNTSKPVAAVGQPVFHQEASSVNLGLSPSGMAEGLSLTQHD